MKAFKDREEKGKAGKFRVGDLVTLSAYGLSTVQNYSIKWEFERNDNVYCALVVSTTDQALEGRTYPIKVKWIGIDKKKNFCTNFYHRELKIARVK
mgnify:CR=1 FL=1